MTAIDHTETTWQGRPSPGIRHPIPDTWSPDPHGPLFMLLVVALVIATLNAALAGAQDPRPRRPPRTRRDGEAILILEDDE